MLVELGSDASPPPSRRPRISEERHWYSVQGASRITGRGAGSTRFADTGEPIVASTLVAKSDTEMADRGGNRLAPLQGEVLDCESRKVRGTQCRRLVVTECFGQPVVARARTHEIKRCQGESGQVGVHPSIMGRWRAVGEEGRLFTSLSGGTPFAHVG